MTLYDVESRTDPSNWTLKACKEYVGGLSNPSKMPGYAYGLPAQECKVGSRLRKVAGSTCQGCYAMKGFYTLYKEVKAAQYNRLDSITKRHWVGAMVRLIGHYSPEVFRFHDAGDIQDMPHLVRIVEVANALPGTKFWLPTREVELVKAYIAEYGLFPTNLTVRISALMNGTNPPKYGLPMLTTSTVHTDTAPGGKGNIECRAYLRDGKCGSCRACWSPRVDNVSYRAH